MSNKVSRRQAYGVYKEAYNECSKQDRLACPPRQKSNRFKTLINTKTKQVYDSVKEDEYNQFVQRYLPEQIITELNQKYNTKAVAVKRGPKDDRRGSVAKPDIEVNSPLGVSSSSDINAVNDMDGFIKSLDTMTIDDSPAKPVSNYKPECIKSEVNVNTLNKAKVLDLIGCITERINTPGSSLVGVFGEIQRIRKRALQFRGDPDITQALERLDLAKDDSYARELKENCKVSGNTLSGLTKLQFLALVECVKDKIGDNVDAKFIKREIAKLINKADDFGDDPDVKRSIDLLTMKRDIYY